MDQREIIVLQVGQCGRRLGAEFWRTAAAEHNIDQSDGPDVVGRADVYFQQSAIERSYTARTLSIDLDPGTSHCAEPLAAGTGRSMRRSRSSHAAGAGTPKLYHPPSAVLSGSSGAANIWARGHYTDGAELCVQVLEQLRLMAERCDCLQGFQLCHSMAGGTGGGLGALIISRLREEYPDRMTATFSVMPTHGASNTVVGPYNSLLTIHHLIESADLVHCVDNNALDALARRKQHVLAGGRRRAGNALNRGHLPRGRPCDSELYRRPGAADTNRLVALAMSGATAAFRFPGLLNGDMRKFAVNMLPFPRLHFLIPSLSPLLRSSRYSSRDDELDELIGELFGAGSSLVACDPHLGRHLTAGIVVRGASVSTYSVERSVARLLDARTSAFANWIPDGVKVTMCNRGIAGCGADAGWLYVDGDRSRPADASSSPSAFGIVNSSCVCAPLRRLTANFSAMFRRKAFLHWYTAEGMDPMEFAEAESDLLDLIAEYEQFAEGGSDGSSSDEAGLSEQFLTLPSLDAAPTGSGSGRPSRKSSYNSGVAANHDG